MKISFLQDGLFSPATTTPHKFLISPRTSANPRLIASPIHFNPGQTLRSQKHGPIFLNSRRDDFGRKSSLQYDLLPSIGHQPSPILEKEPVLKPKNLRAIKSKLPATIIGPPRKASEAVLLSDIAKIYGKSKSEKPFFGKRPEELVVNNFHTARPMELKSPVIEQAKSSLKLNMVQNIFQQTFTPILPKNSPKENPAIVHVRNPSTLKSPRKEESPAPVQAVQIKPKPALGEANVPIIKKTHRKRVVSDLIIKISPRKTSRKNPLESPQTLKSPALREVRERLQAEESLASPTNFLEGADLSNYFFTNPHDKDGEENMIGFSVKSRTITNKKGRSIFISTLNGLSRPELTNEEQTQSVNTARSINAKTVFSLKKDLIPVGSIGTASTLESAQYRGYPRKQSTREDGPWINEESSRDQDSVLQGLVGFIKDETQDLDDCSFIDKRNEEVFDDSLVILG